MAISYDDAYAKAISELASANAQEICAARGASLDRDTIGLSFLNTTYAISLPSCDITPEGLNQAERLLLLHYLTSAGSNGSSNVTGGSESDRFASYESLPGGMFYFPTFKKRGPLRLQQLLGPNPDLLYTATDGLGARKAEFGDAALIIPVLPLIDMSVVVDAADEEFPAEIRFLFTKDILSFLSLEDIAVLGGTVATRITRLAGNTGR